MEGPRLVQRGESADPRRLVVDLQGNLLQLVGVLLAVVRAEEQLEPAGKRDADVGLGTTPITTVGGV
jgi:hypothetical protein